MATEEDMYKLMDTGADISKMSKREVDYSKLTAVMEMMASGSTGLPSVTLMAENLMFFITITEEQYFSALKTRLENLSTMDYRAINEITTFEFLGQSYKQMTFQIDDLNVFQDYIFRKIGNRMVGLIITYSPDTLDELDILMKGFSKF